MNYGINIQALISCRSEPSHRAELVTQLLFGESFEILDQKQDWSRIRNLSDGYQGWCDSQQITELLDTQPSIEPKDIKLCGDALGYVTNNQGLRFAIPCGSVLPRYSEGSFSINEHHFGFEGRVARYDRESIVRHARRFINAPYLWGGKSVFGIDCSGFTQVVFGCAGYHLLRDASQQATQGEPIKNIGDAKTNDLAFFVNELEKISHVGILLNNREIIHASGKVRIDQLDEQGILRTETNKHSHKLHSIRRISRE